MDEVFITDVGPRDGLQNEKIIISTQDKLVFIKDLVAAGLKSVEATSFVKAESIPQMSDASELYSKLNHLGLSSGTKFPCLIPNLRGLEAAMKVGVRDIAVFVATSESFSKKNVNASIDETLTRVREVVKVADLNNIKVRGYISTSFGCPYEGFVPLNNLVKIVEELIKLNVSEVSIGDTTGVATPTQVREALKVLIPEFGANKLAMHFHDTRGMALSNILVSLDAGIRSFDSSAGGLGGCPYAMGATGNVATEDVWYLCESYGLKTGIDFYKLVQASMKILKLVHKDSPSKLINAYLKSGKL